MGTKKKSSRVLKPRGDEPVHDESILIRMKS